MSFLKPQNDNLTNKNKFELLFQLLLEFWLLSCRRMINLVENSPVKKNKGSCKIKEIILLLQLPKNVLFFQNHCFHHLLFLFYALFEISKTKWSIVFYTSLKFWEFEQKFCNINKNSTFPKLIKKSYKRRPTEFLDFSLDPFCYILILNKPWN